jgi:hypothetical protein
LDRHQRTFGVFTIRPLYETLHEIRPGRTETTMDEEALLESYNQCMCNNNYSKFHATLLKNLRFGPKTKFISETLLTGT